MIAVLVVFVALLGIGLAAAAIAVVWARVAEANEARRIRDDIEAVRRATGREPE